MRDVIDELGVMFRQAVVNGDEARANAYSKAVTILKKDQKKKKRKAQKKARKAQRGN
jgi:hypothetical protein